MRQGTLYGIGVGPGDPDLLTFKAARVLGEADVVFAAASSGKDYSTALGIARPHLKHDARTCRLSFPMTRDRMALRSAWDANADAVIEVLEQGLDAAFLTLGDPLTYSTFGYLMRTVLDKRPGASVEVVPGIASYQAAAAAARRVLAEGEDVLALVSGTEGGSGVDQAAAWADRVVVLKAYKRFDEIRDALDRNGLLDGATLVSNCGMEGETLVTDMRTVDGLPGYFTLILAAKPRCP